MSMATSCRQEAFLPAPGRDQRHSLQLSCCIAVSSPRKLIWVKASDVTVTPAPVVAAQHLITIAENAYAALSRAPDPFLHSRLHLLAASSELYSRPAPTWLPPSHLLQRCLIIPHQGQLGQKLIPLLDSSQSLLEAASAWQSQPPR